LVNTKSEKSNNKKTVFILCLLIIVLFALETSFLSNITKIEGVKLGLYNTFIIFAIKNIKLKYGYILAIVKIISSLFIASTLFLYSFLGGILSVSAMVIAERLFKEKIGFIGIGIIGAFVYNTTVYVIAFISLSSAAVFYNIPTVLFLSVLYGAITGSLAFVLTKYNVFRLGYGEENEKK